ncbi:hypothetical protein Tco_1540351 [Tanacetum coccineum]
MREATTPWETYLRRVQFACEIYECKSVNSGAMGRDKAKVAAKNKGSKASGSSTMNDDALARLTVTEMTAAKVAQREKFMELKRREVECHEREIAAAEYRAQQEDIRLYLQPYEHLSGEQRLVVFRIDYCDELLQGIGGDVGHTGAFARVETSLRNRMRDERQTRIGIKRQLASVQESHRQDREDFKKFKDFMTIQFGYRP